MPTAPLANVKSRNDSCEQRKRRYSNFAALTRSWSHPLNCYCLLIEMVRVLSRNCNQVSRENSRRFESG